MLYFTIDKFSLLFYTVFIQRREKEREKRDLTEAINNRKTNSRRRHSIQARFHLTISQYVYPLMEYNMFQRKSSRGWRKKKRREKKNDEGMFYARFLLPVSRDVRAGKL